jgi:ribonuclease HII
MISGATILTKMHIFFRQYDDSKAVSAAKRSLLFEKVKADPEMLWRTDAISAQDISFKMLAPNRMSLNEIAVQSTLQLLRSLQQDGMNIVSVSFCLCCSL